jgi:RNA polymerase sigma-70 factor, ECF subfamily
VAVTPIDSELLDELVLGARHGSGPAFTQLWELFSGPVAGYVRGLGVQEADDVTSEVFLTAFGSIERFSGAGQQFRAWLFTIAHHRAMDDLRRRIRQPAGTEFDPVADGRQTPSAETEALERISVGECLDVLQHLPDDQRDVLLLRLVADLPVEHVATVLERSADAVRQLQHRALAALRRELSAPNEMAVTRRR